MWETYQSRDVTAAFRGITTPINELYAEIAKRGWEANVQFKTREGYVAAGKNPHGESLEATGPDDATAIGNLLVKIMRRETIRRSHNRKLAIWETTFTNRMEEIAKAYAQAPVYDPKAAGAWKELADDSTRRAEVIRQQIQVEVVPDPEPYQSSQEMCDDVHKNKHFFVSSANSSHPVWTTQQNVDFRIVHDVLGHCVSGGDFGWDGENRACAAHFPLLSPNAQKALFTECIAQTAAGSFFRSFMPQKVAFIDDHIEDAQEKENPDAHQGLHPSQSVVPTEMPTVSPSEPQGLWWATQVPNTDFQGGIPVFGNIPAPSDPNVNWSSGIDPLPDAGYLWHGDPLEADKVRDTARQVDTRWHELEGGDGTPDLDSMRQAIVNAFRVVLLSPRKDLRWNAVHYQDIAHVPATVTDPQRYWEALENRREDWNQSRGFAPGSHKPHWKEEQQFRQIRRMQILTEEPQWHEDQADKIIDRELVNMRGSIEDRLLRETKHQKLDNQQLENKVNNELKKLLKEIVKPTHEDADEHHHQMRLAAQQTLEGQEAGKYGAFMYGHLKALAQISDHADEILDAAIDDVKSNQGRGHLFRNKVLQLGISGVGPKVCSFAWLLLQPMTSQLATIDVHMMDVLGHDYDKKMNDRDYYRFERELAAGRDASGYGHIPLGQFQWGMWDYKRTGPGTHQDHSAMRVLDPTPHHTVDWATKLGQPQQDWKSPEWWEATSDARKTVADHWDQNVATQFTRDKIPRLAKQAYRGWGAEKSFKHWWDKRKREKNTITTRDARILAEYAVGEKLSRKKAEDFITAHRTDVSSFDSFKKKFLEEYEDLKNKHSSVRNSVGKKLSENKIAGTERLPWVLWGEKVWVGNPGETFMNLARRQLGYSTQEVWQQLPDEVFSVGVYDPNTQRVFAPNDRINAHQEETILRAVQNRGVMGAT